MLFLFNLFSEKLIPTFLYLMQIYEYFISYNSLAFSLCQIIQILSRTRGVSIPRIIIQAYVTMFICILMHSIGMLGSINSQHIVIIGNFNGSLHFLNLQILTTKQATPYASLAEVKPLCYQILIRMRYVWYLHIIIYLS